MDATAIRTPTVCELVGISYRQLDFWARTDLVRPSIADAHGSGSARLYSVDDVILLVVIKHLLDNGASLQAVRPVVEEVGRTLFDVGSVAWLVIDRDGPVGCETTELAAVLRDRRGPLLQVLHLGRVVEETRALVAAQLAVPASA